MTTTASQHREAATAADTRAAESFDRCDTDGFVSQWASGITARLERAKADLADAGGLASFPALFDTDGNLVPAKLVDGRYGMVWGLLPGADPSGRFTGWFSPSGAAAAARRQATDARKGYQVGRVLAPAAATIMGSGTGLAGAASCYVGRYRTDGGYSAGAQIVTTADYTDR
jgi:hypothetical protein